MRRPGRAGRPPTSPPSGSCARSRPRTAPFIGFGATELANTLFRRAGETFRPGWEEMGHELEEMVTAAELAGLARATQYAHYTPEFIVRAMWATLTRMGFTGGSVLEPGCGTGLFMSLMPETLAGKTSLTGIEADPITARIADRLFPDAWIRSEDFTKARIAETFDLAIGKLSFATNMATLKSINPLKKRRLLRKHARFGDELARKFDIAWEDDLFGQGGDDNLHTTRTEEFFATQTEWLAASLADLHPRPCILTVATYGGAELPAGAQRAYGQPEDGDEMGFYLDRHTGAVESIPFRMPVRSGASRNGDGASLPKTAAARADVTQKGVAMIGDFRTDALHQALRESEIDDQTLIGLLVLALAGRNVTVQSPVQRATYRPSDDRERMAGQVIEGGVLTTDPDTVRTAARAMLGQVLSCRDGMTDSGAVARVAGDAIGADRFLPNMATDDFLKCLSKGAMERAASAERVLPRNTGKATRAALIEQVGQGTYVLPAARFALTRAELEKLDARSAETTFGADEEGPGGLPDGEEGGDFTADLPHPSNDAGLTEAAA